MKQNKIIFYTSVLVGALQGFSYNLVIASSETAQVGSEITKVVTKTTSQTILSTLPILTLVYQAGTLGVQIIKHFFPTDEQKAQTLNTNNQLHSMEAFERFRACLLAHPRRNSIIGQLDIPIACETAAKQLAKNGATNEVNKMINYYKSPVIKLIFKEQHGS